jgi:serine/threonine protein kinase
VIPYIAPETLAHTKESEVYSLGVILWECSAGRPPFPGEDFSTLGRQIVYDHRRETPIPNTPAWYVELYEWCWHPDPASRPTVHMVWEILTYKGLGPLPDDPIIRDHPAILQWLSLSRGEREQQIENAPWPGGLHPPSLYDRDMFTSNIFKTLDTEATEATRAQF